MAGIIGKKELKEYLVQTVENESLPLFPKVNDNYDLTQVQTYLTDYRKALLKRIWAIEALCYLRETGNSNYLNHLLLNAQKAGITPVVFHSLQHHHPHRDNGVELSDLFQENYDHCVDCGIVVDKAELLIIDGQPYCLSCTPDQT